MPSRIRAQSVSKIRTTSQILMTNHQSETTGGERKTDDGWSGNVRELQNVLAQVSLMARGKETVERDALPEAVRRAAGEARPTLAELQEAMERKAIGDALGRSGGELRGAAKELGISQVALSRMAERFAPGREEPGRER